MAHQPQRSLRHEYDIFVEQEIENYKDSIPRSSLLRIGDDAVTRLRERRQLEFDEILIWAEVDAIIRRRLRIPSFTTWRNRRLKLIAAYRRPEHWGIAADAPLVREVVKEETERHVLVAGLGQESTAMFLVANGCQVTAVEDDPDMVERVVSAASVVGLTSRVHTRATPLDRLDIDYPVYAVVCSQTALERLTPAGRARVIDAFQSATLDGGVHLVETLVAGQIALGEEELRDRYRGWDISIVRDEQENCTFMARKLVA